jgi:2-polyprenyl-3-methyl-5-hydroxy-6-metoxy-1,4-benzoquinol methylase
LSKINAARCSNYDKNVFVKNIYDELYQDSDYYGPALPDVLEYFEKLPKTFSVLDVGCGQGRYALALAKMGFNLTAIDNSKRAINQLDDKIKTSGLKCRALLKDAFLFEDYSSYDVLFFHLFFHFNPHELNREKNLLKRIATDLKVGSKLVITGYKDESDQELIASIFKDSIGFNIHREMLLTGTDKKSQTQGPEYVFIAIEKKYDSSAV